MTPEECLSAAWTYCAPMRSEQSFPRGFWPDVARVAMEMFAQQTKEPTLDFQPTKCQRGNAPEVRISSKTSKKLGLDLGKLEINL
jgi:hypothetical protein